MPQPLKAATPAVAVSGFVAHVSVAPDVPVPLAMAIWMTADESVSAFPYTSSTVTVGCVPSAAPAVPPVGSVVKANWDGEPAGTVTSG